MLHNPFWRIVERERLSVQSLELQAYISRIELQKYLFIAGAILIAITASVLLRLLAL
jgi:hypothetical protein